MDLKKIGNACFPKCIICQCEMLPVMIDYEDGSRIFGWQCECDEILRGKYMENPKEDEIVKIELKKDEDDKFVVTVDDN